jgi:hypothetical protein
MFRFTGKKTFVLVKNPAGGPAHRWPCSWQNCGIEAKVKCHYCGKEFTAITDFRNNWVCRVAGGKLVGRLTPVILGNAKIRVSPGDDHEHWDFVCRDCEPSRKSDWMGQQKGKEPWRK